MKLDINTIGSINIFENITGSEVKDCIENNGKLIFIVEESQLGKALGKKGSNLQRAKNIMKKDIQVIVFSNDVLKFVSYLMFPNKAKDISLLDGVITIKTGDLSTKGKIFGRNRENLKKINEILKRHFKDVKDVRIV